MYPTSVTGYSGILIRYYYDSLHIVYTHKIIKFLNMTQNYILDGFKLFEMIRAN